MGILGIDPGLTGAFVYLTRKEFRFALMPVQDKRVDFDGVRALIARERPAQVILERAMPLAMGSKHAFNYGRDFAALEIAIRLSKTPVLYVLPKDWMKTLLEGVDARLKPKERSQIAVRRLFPHLVSKIPANKNGKLHEGIVDALLIAAYGLNKNKPFISEEDF